MSGTSPTVVRLHDLTWPEVRASLAAGVTAAVVAVGSTEQHGPHLPLATDTLIGEALCERVAARIGGGVIAPAIPVGLSAIHMDFPGSLSVNRSALRGTLGGYCASLAGHGFTRIVVIPSHGGNFSLVEEVVAEMNDRPGGTRVATFTDWRRLLAAFAREMAPDGLAPDAPGLHAGEVETSIMLHLRPDMVRMERAEAGYTGAASGERPYGKSIREVSAIGVLGDPRRASPERGARYVAAWVELIVAAAGARP